MVIPKSKALKNRGQQLTGILLFFLIVFFSSCQNAPTAKASELEDQNKHSNASTKYIDIQPFADMDREEVNYVYNTLKKICPHVILKKAIALPVSAFYKSRNRYRADSLIHFLGANTEEGYTTIGITNKDISTTKGIVTDWGVMGLGNCPVMPALFPGSVFQNQKS